MVLGPVPPSSRPVFEKASEANPDIAFGKVDTEAERTTFAARAAHHLDPDPHGLPRKASCLRAARALPAAALDQLIGAVRGSDMEQVRAQLEAEQGATGSALPTYAYGRTISPATSPRIPAA